MGRAETPRPKIPYYQLERIVVKLGEDRLRKVEEIQYLRREKTELEVLLRSALRELAVERQDPRPRVFADAWMRERRNLSL